MRESYWGVVLFTFEIRFYPRSFEEPFIDEFDDAMQWYVAALAKNGQILPTYQISTRLANCYVYHVVAPEMDSLDEMHDNKYCRMFLATVVEKSHTPPEISLVGGNYDIEDCCVCEDPSYYVLSTPDRAFEPPVVCGDCQKNLPLYRLPKTDDGEEYYAVLWWQRVYQACDLQFLSGIGERHGYRMMNNPTSELAEEGLRICAHWEEQVKKPFYYFLYKHYRRNGPTCPKCADNWVNEDPGIKYDYVCGKCRLVSNDLGD